VASSKHHRGPVWSLAYSQGEGALLASGGADHTVRIWNAKPGAAGGPPGGGAAAAGAATAQPPQPQAQQQQQQQQAGKASGDGGSGQGEPYEQLCAWRTKLTPVYGLRFTTRNLLLGSGALTIPSRK
jgi:transcription initiation factor TFIID subunit 5